MAPRVAQIVVVIDADARRRSPCAVSSKQLEHASCRRRPGTTAACPGPRGVAFRLRSIVSVAGNPPSTRVPPPRGFAAGAAANRDRLLRRLVNSPSARRLMWDRRCQRNVGPPDRCLSDARCVSLELRVGGDSGVGYGLWRGARRVILRGSDFAATKPRHGAPPPAVA